jgi:hypothetical protein
MTWRRTMKDSCRLRDVTLLSILSGSIAGFDRLLLAGVRAVLRAPVPALTFVVVDAARDVKPHYNVLWAMRLCGALHIEEWWQRLGDDCRLGRRRRRRGAVTWQQAGEGKERHGQCEAFQHRTNLRGPKLGASGLYYSAQPLFDNPPGLIRRGYGHLARHGARLRPRPEPALQRRGAADRRRGAESKAEAS